VDVMFCNFNKMLSKGQNSHQPKKHF